MSTLTAALTAYYAAKTPPVTAVIGVRQDLGLGPTILGYSNDAAGLERYDADIQLRITARAPGVASELKAVQGAYNWEANPDIVALGADALRLRVLGDMARKAIRTDPSYIELARSYYSDAKDVIKQAADAMVDTQKEEAGEKTIPSIPHSQNVRLRRVW